MKKLLSIILAIAMIAAMLPNVFAADTTETEEFTGYEYVFNNSVYEVTSEITREGLVGKEFSDVKAGGPWKLASVNSVHPKLRTDNFKLEAANKVNEKACFAIELKVEQGGTYLPKLAYTRSGQTGIVDIYLAKKGTSVTYNGTSYTTDNLDSALDSITHENTYNFLKGIVDDADGQYVLKTDLDMYQEAGTDTVEEFGKRELTLEGNTSYYLIVNIKGANKAFSGVSYPYVFLNSFSLTPAPQKHTYDFSYMGLGKNDKVDKSVLFTMSIDSFSSDISEPWRYAGDYYGISSEAQANGLYWNAYSKRAGESSGCFGIELAVTDGGMLVPSLTYVAKPSAPKVEVYLAKEDVSVSDYAGTYTPAGLELSDGKVYRFIAGLGNEYKLAQFDMYSSVEEIKTTTFAPMEIDSNSKYYLLFRTVGLNDSFSPLVYDTADYLEITLDSFELTPVKDIVNEEFIPTVDTSATVQDTASVQMYAYYGGIEKSLGEIGNVTYGKSVTVPAPAQSYTDEETNTTYAFRYWTKGLENKIGKNRQALSADLSFDYMPHEGANYLIAVYEEENTATEAFYNYNGQLLTGLKIDENDKLPELPSMAGFDEPAIKWVQLGTGAEFDAKADVSAVEGKKIFMAKYESDEPTANITINGTSYVYGDEIICKKIVTYDADNFSYWARTINDVREIVSVDPDYSFRAFTDCTIEAVCVGKISVDTPRKIVLSTFEVGDMTAVMAEFIGFGDAKEKGIMFGGQKIAMTTDYAQFTVTNDTTADVTVTGYAVVGTDRINDGSITVSGITVEE